MILRPFHEPEDFHSLCHAGTQWADEEATGQKGEGLVPSLPQGRSQPYKTGAHVQTPLLLEVARFFLVFLFISLVNFKLIEVKT